MSAPDLYKKYLHNNCLIFIQRPSETHSPLKSIRLHGGNLTEATTAIARSPFLEKLTHLTLPGHSSLEDKQEARLLLSRSPYLNNVKLGMAGTPQEKSSTMNAVFVLTDRGASTYKKDAVRGYPHSVFQG